MAEKYLESSAGDQKGAELMNEPGESRLAGA